MWKIKIIKRFWKKVNKTSDCWLWTASKRAVNYGGFWIDGKLYNAHRIAYEIAYGRIPDKHEVCHRCDNPPCVRPDHLFTATHQDNMKDMGRKDRDCWSRYPEKNPRRGIGR